MFSLSLVSPYPNNRLPYYGFVFVVTLPFDVDIEYYHLPYLKDD